MKKSKFLSLDSLSFQDFDSDAELIPLMTPEDEEEMNREKLPEDLPILPLRNMVLFPGIAMPVMLGRQKSLRLAKEVQGKKILIGVICQKDRETDDPGMDDLYNIGVIAEVVRVLDMPDGTTTAILQGKKRFELKEITQTEPYLKGKVELLEDVMPDKKDREFEALISTIKDLTIKMLKSEGDPSRDMIFSIKNNNNVIYLINFSCTNVVSGSEKMELLL